jgi:hypothetical protein
MVDTVRNAGGSVALSSRVGHFLVPADNPAGTRRPLSTKGTTRQLSAGQEVTTSRSVTIPKTVQPGSYGVLVCADIGGAMPESDETNNCRTAPGTLTVGYPDLAVADLAGAPGRVRPGETFEVTDTTRNDGVLGARSTSVLYYLSSTAALAADAVILRTRSLPALAAGQDSTGTATVKVGSAVAAGTYYVVACVKAGPGDPVTNNCLASATRTTVAP